MENFKEKLQNYIMNKFDNSEDRENLKVKGTWDFTLTHEDGSVEVMRKENIIVAGGFDFICAQVAGTVGTAMSYIAVGTGTTAAATSQTALVTQSAIAAATYAHTTGTQYFTLSTTFAAGTATAALTEAAVFNASSSGTMLNRVVFSTINKGASDTLTVTFTFTLS